MNGDGLDKYRFKFRERMYNRMASTGITAKDIAFILNISEQAVYHYMSARDLPKSGTLIRLADILKTTPDYLLGYEKAIEDNATVGTVINIIENKRSNWSDSDKLKVVKAVTGEWSDVSKRNL